MEIHGNVFTVSTVWGTEYQSSVSAGVCPLRQHYLLDENTIPMACRWTECQRYKGTQVKLQGWRSACETKRCHFFPPLLLNILKRVSSSWTLRWRINYSGWDYWAEWNAHLLCVPTSAVEDVELWPPRFHWMRCVSVHPDVSTGCVRTDGVRRNNLAQSTSRTAQVEFYSYSPFES